MDDHLSDEEDAFIPPEKLIETLEMLIGKIRSQHYSEVTIQDIYDSLEEYITGIPKKLDPETVAYLFRGWWISDAIRQAQSDSNPLGVKLPICPFCLQKMPPENEGERKHSSVEKSEKEKK